MMLFRSTWINIHIHTLKLTLPTEAPPSLPDDDGLYLLEGPTTVFHWAVSLEWDDNSLVISNIRITSTFVAK